MSLAQEFETTKKRGAKAIYNFFMSINANDYDINSYRDLMELNLFARCLSDQYFDTIIEDKVSQLKDINGIEEFAILKKVIEAVLLVDDHHAIAMWGEFLTNYPEAEPLLAYIEDLLDNKLTDRTSCQAALINENGETERVNIYREQSENYTGLYSMLMTLFTEPNYQLIFLFVKEGDEQIKTLILRNNNDEDGVVVVSGELEDPNIKLITPENFERN